MATTTDEYRVRADECAKQALEARNSTMKGIYQDMGRMWLHLAEQRTWLRRRPDGPPADQEPPPEHDTHASA